MGMVNVGGPTHLQRAEQGPERGPHLRRVERRDASWGRAPHASARRSGRQHLRRGGRRASVTTGSYAARNARHDVVTREPTDGVERPKYRRDRLRALYMFATLSATRRAAHQTSSHSSERDNVARCSVGRVGGWVGMVNVGGPTHLRRVDRRTAHRGCAPHASERRSRRQHLRRWGGEVRVRTGSHGGTRRPPAHPPPPPPPSPPTIPRPSRCLPNLSPNLRPPPPASRTPARPPSLSATAQTPALPATLLPSAPQPPRPHRARAVRSCRGSHFPSRPAAPQHRPPARGASKRV